MLSAQIAARTQVAYEHSCRIGRGVPALPIAAFPLSFAGNFQQHRVPPSVSPPRSAPQNSVSRPSPATGQSREAKGISKANELRWHDVCHAANDRNGDECAGGQVPNFHLCLLVHRVSPVGLQPTKPKPPQPPRVPPPGAFKSQRREPLPQCLRYLYWVARTSRSLPVAPYPAPAVYTGIDSCSPPDASRISSTLVISICSSIRFPLSSKT